MSQKIKKLCFFNSDPKWGGGVTFFKDHVVELRNLGYNVIGICSQGSMLSQWYAESEIEYSEFRVSRRSFINPWKLLKLIKFYKRSNIDAVIFTTSEDLKFGGIAAKLAGVPRIIYRRGLAVPIKNSISNRILFKNVITHIIANSEETKRTVLKHLSGYVHPDKIKVIFNGIDTDKHIQAPHNPIWQFNGSGDHPIVIGNAGRLSPEKGQLQLIAIAKALKARKHNFIILIAGSGILEQPLRKAIRENGLDNHIQMIGYVENIDRFMQSIDIFVLTSYWEGFGYVLVEAMLHQKPVVAFDTSSIPEVVIHDKTGFLAPVKDEVSFASRLSELIENKGLRNAFGIAGKKSAIRKFELAKQVQEFENQINT